MEVADLCQQTRLAVWSSGPQLGRDFSCSICQQKFEAGEITRVVTTQEPCLHTFHAACLEQWLSERTDCPCCRVDLTIPDLLSAQHSDTGQGDDEAVGGSSNVVYADGWITLEEQRLRLHQELRVSALGALHYRYEYESPLSPHWYRYEYQYEYQYDYDNENPMSENEGEVEREYNAEQWSGSAWEWRSSERESNPWHRWSGWTDDETWRNSHRGDNDATNDNGRNRHARWSRQQWLWE